MNTNFIPDALRGGYQEKSRKTTVSKRESFWFKLLSSPSECVKAEGKAEKSWVKLIFSSSFKAILPMHLLGK